MTTPFDPANHPADASPTEPVPGPPTFEPAAPVFEPAPVTPAPVRPATAPARPAASRGVSIVNVALGVAVLVATAGVAFAVGRSTAPAAVSVASIDTPGGRFFANGGGPGASFDPDAIQGRPGNGTGNGNGNGFGRFGFGGSPTIEGTVDSITADSITIRTDSGATITLGLDSATTYHQQADATASDVTAGSTVRVQTSGGFRPGQDNGGNGANGNGGNNGSGNGNEGTIDLGTASDVTVVP